MFIILKFFGYSVVMRWSSLGGNFNNERYFSHHTKCIYIYVFPTEIYRKHFALHEESTAFTSVWKSSSLHWVKLLPILLEITSLVTLTKVPIFCHYCDVIIVSCYRHILLHLPQHRIWHDDVKTHWKTKQWACKNTHSTRLYSVLTRIGLMKIEKGLNFLKNTLLCYFITNTCVFFSLSFSLLTLS